jgi:hypothetical protein
LTLTADPFTVAGMTTDSTARVLDGGGPLFLHERPPYEPMPACGRGVCVEMAADVATAGDSILVSLRPMERHDGGPAMVELQRVHAAVSLTTGQCDPRDATAERYLAEHPWIVAALASQLDLFRRRALRWAAQRDRSSYRAALNRVQPGAMIPHDRLFPHDWDLIVGHHGRMYWATDQHCPNAACSCREIVVQLHDLNAAPTRPVGQLRIDLQSGKPHSKASSPLAAQLFDPLWAQYSVELTRRHDEVRRVVVAHAASRGETRATTPGRNAPCPCGSGKNFKRCCALDERAGSHHSPSTQR